MFNILMPVDFSESSLNAFTYAAQMTRALHARLMLLHVVEPIDGDATMFIDDSTVEQEIEEARETLYKLSNEALQYINSAFIEVNVATGFVVDKILQVGKENETSLIVMGTKGSNNRLEDIFGSNTYKIVKQAECAVLTIPIESSKFDIKRIALAARLHDKENIHLLSILKHLARHFKAEIIFLHVTKDSSISLEDDVNSEAVLWLSEQLKDFKTSFVNISSESTANAINEYAIKSEVDLLAVSPGKHNIFKQLVEGSTTRKLVLHSRVPLLTLPADY